MTYTPRPLDTHGVALPPELAPLRERLAEHVHDIWALGRLEQGWRHGPTRDDDARTHPCLVPYAELPDAEKEYDRRTAEATLAAILALGFRIVAAPPAGDAPALPETAP